MLSFNIFQVTTKESKGMMSSSLAENFAFRARYTTLSLECYLT